MWIKGGLHCCSYPFPIPLFLLFTCSETFTCQSWWRLGREHQDLLSTGGWMAPSQCHSNESLQNTGKVVITKRTLMSSLHCHNKMADIKIIWLCSMTQWTSCFVIFFVIWNFPTFQWWFWWITRRGMGGGGFIHGESLRFRRLYNISETNSFKSIC